jgi:hypothetical protein
MTETTATARLANDNTRPEHVTWAAALSDAAIADLLRTVADNPERGSKTAAMLLQAAARLDRADSATCRRANAHCHGPIVERLDEAAAAYGDYDAPRILLCSYHHAEQIDDI